MPGGSKERDPSIEGVGWGAMGLDRGQNAIFDALQHQSSHNDLR